MTTTAKAVCSSACIIKDGTLCAVIHPKFIETKIRSSDSNSLTDILANVHTTSRIELVIIQLAL